MMVLVDAQLIRDIQSNAATGEPEWRGIEERLLKITSVPSEVAAATLDDAMSIVKPATPNDRADGTAKT